MKKLGELAAMIDRITKNLISDGFLVFPDKSELSLPHNCLIQEDALLQIDTQALHPLPKLSVELES